MDATICNQITTEEANQLFRDGKNIVRKEVPAEAIIYMGQNAWDGYQLTVLELIPGQNLIKVGRSYPISQGERIGDLLVRKGLETLACSIQRPQDVTFDVAEEVSLVDVYETTQDLFDANGRLIYKKGMTLDTVGVERLKKLGALFSREVKDGVCYLSRPKED